MPARDFDHANVVQALQKSGWRITADPYIIILPERTLFIDLRAEQDTEKRSVIIEIKGFTSESQVEALASALGKYLIYQAALSMTKIADPLYLAIPRNTFEGIFNEALTQQLVKEHRIRLLVFDPKTQEVLKWIS